MKTNEKYLSFLNDLHMRGEFKTVDIYKDWKLSRSIIPTLTEMGVLENTKRGVFKWIGKEPTESMVIVMKETRRAALVNLEEARKKEIMENIVFPDQYHIDALKASKTAYKIIRVDEIEI